MGALMVKLALVPARKAHEASPLLGSHRGAATEGDAVRQILEQAGYPPKKSSRTQFECACPFHEEPGPVPKNKSPNFYVNRESGLHYCHSASCGEKGNLQTLERYFGLDISKPEYQGREQKLQHFEAALTPERRQVLYDEGLNDTTIERFRVGWVDEYRVPDERHPEGRRMAANCYVFPYLEGRRAVAFRFYDPQCNGPGGSKYWWEEGIGARPYNIGDAIGDKDGRVFICEGEKKAMLLTQLGYAAVGLPGASNFKREWHEAFTHAKKILVCFDSDNPEYHIYAKCNKCGEGKCTGHNPGQEAAVKLVEQFGWRASNVVLPLPEGERKVDINEFFVRDGFTAPDFAELALGIRKTPYVVSSLAEIEENPPDEAAFIVEHGILPRGGRLLISGAPKTGKSILAEHLALSVASGIPFLHRFGIDEVDGRRVLLLDRELSERALFDRLQEFIAYRPGYKVGRGNLLIDHEHQLRLDLKDSYDPMSQLIEQNGVDVVILDTAYKFFQGDMESSSALMKVFDTLDRVIANTGVSVVVTHHQRKKVGGQKRRDTDIGDPDNVAGSFLWTGWPNATVLLDFMDRRLNSPFNVVASFTAFRDAAPPDPLGLYRDKDSINYSAIQDYRPDQEAGPAEMHDVRPTEETVGDLLIKLVPTVEDDFMHLAATKFGCRVDTIRPFVVSLIDKGYFTRTNGRPPVLKHADREEETYEEGKGLPSAQDAQLRLVTDIDPSAMEVQ